MATDLGRKYTDAQIASIEKQLKKEYSQALKEMQAKCNKVLSSFEKTDALMRAKEQKGDITHKQYIEWRNRAILKNKQVQGMVQDLTERAVNADKIAADYINGRIPRVFAENTNFATYEIERQSRIDTNFTLVSEDAVSGLVTGRTPIFPIAKVDIPKDKQWNEKKIRSAITQGVLQGEAIPKIASRLQRVTDMDRVSATRSARTLMGRAQNEGRLESIKRAHDLGLPVKKIWIATLDHRTRDSHVDLDGEVQDFDSPFSNGLDYPCASGPPEEVYNCRCDMRPIYKGSKFDASDLGLRNTSHMEEQSYQEWKDAHKRQERQKAVQDISAVVNGSDISSTWTRRADKFDFEIEDIINAQGFDGLPRIVSASEFDEYVKESSFIAQRTYSAPTQETLDAYREQLYEGKWYVDCSTGGSAYGKGMYCAGNYDGKLTDSIIQEMKDYQNQNLNYSGAQSVHAVETFTLSKDAKIIDLTELQKMQYSEGKKDVIIAEMIKDANLSKEDMAYMLDEYRREIMVGSGSIFDYEYLRDIQKINESIQTQSQDDYYENFDKALDKFLNGRTQKEIKREADKIASDREKLKDMDSGSYAALLGYDGIRTEHGKCGADTIILNRTKCIFKGE